MVDDNQKQKDIKFLREYELTMKRRFLITLILITKQIISLYEYLPDETEPPMTIEDHLRCISIMEEAITGKDHESLEAIYATMADGVDTLYSFRDYLEMQKAKRIKSN